MEQAFGHFPQQILCERALVYKLTAGVHLTIVGVSPSHGILHNSQGLIFYGLLISTSLLQADACLVGPIRGPLFNKHLHQFMNYDEL